MTSSGLTLSEFSVPREGFPIVRDVSFSAPAGEVTVLLGANGAGKTTLLEAVSGLIPSSGGTVSLGGVELANASRLQRSRAGLGHVEQGRKVFAELTVAENMLVGSTRAKAVEEALELFPELRPRQHVLAGALSGGEQQMVVIARAIAAEPKALLIDEMSLGLAPVIVQRLMPIVRQLADDGMTVVLVEQYADLALRIGDEAYVLNRGEIILRGSADELAHEPERVRDAYLGVGVADAPSGASTK